MEIALTAKRKSKTMAMMRLPMKTPHEGQVP